MNAVFVTEGSRTILLYGPSRVVKAAAAWKEATRRPFPAMETTRTKYIPEIGDGGEPNESDVRATVPRSDGAGSEALEREGPAPVAVRLEAGGGPVLPSRPVRGTFGSEAYKLLDAFDIAEKEPSSVLGSVAGRPTGSRSPARFEVVESIPRGALVFMCCCNDV